MKLCGPRRLPYALQRALFPARVSVLGLAAFPSNLCKFAVLIRISLGILRAATASGSLQMDDEMSTTQPSYHEQMPDEERAPSPYDCQPLC